MGIVVYSLYFCLQDIYISICVCMYIYIHTWYLPYIYIYYPYPPGGQEHKKIYILPQVHRAARRSEARVFH